MWCFDRRVLWTLGAVALGVLVFDHALFARALPVLVALACPVSILVMMRTMSGGNTAPPDGSAGPTSDRAERDEIARLRAEVAALRAEAAPTPGWPGRSHERIGGRTEAPSGQP